MIMDASHPRSAKCWILALGQDERVLDGNAGLIVVAVQYPSAELLAREPTLVHGNMKRVKVVVAGGPLLPQALDERLAVPGLIARLASVLRRRDHSAISIPSNAISTPAPRTSAHSGPSSRNRGFVLLRWMRMRLRAPSCESRSRPPAGPPTGKWAMSSARLVPTPLVSSSSLDQNVPSKNTASADASTRSRVSVQLAAAGT